MPHEHFMVNPVDTMSINSMAKTSVEHASPSRWLTTAGWTRLAVILLMGSMNPAKARLSNMLREKGVADQ
jgi:hypothetical protein